MTENTPKTDVKMGSDRNFGFVFAGAFTVLSILPAWKGASLWWPVLVIAALFLIVALVRPAILRPLNTIWFKFGLLLHAIFSPLIMFIVYVLAFVPTGLIARLRGKDPLERRFDPEIESYWHVRERQPGSMKQQF